MIFIEAKVRGPFPAQGGDVYSVEALWNDNGENFRRAYSQLRNPAQSDPAQPDYWAQNDYQQMQFDFAEWPDANGNHPDAATYAAQAHWTI